MIETEIKQITKLLRASESREKDVAGHMDRVAQALGYHCAMLSPDGTWYVSTKDGTLNLMVEMIESLVREAEERKYSTAGCGTVYRVVGLAGGTSKPKAEPTPDHEAALERDHLRKNMTAARQEFNRIAGALGYNHATSSADAPLPPEDPPRWYGVRYDGVRTLITDAIENKLVKPAFAADAANRAEMDNLKSKYQIETTIHEGLKVVVDQLAKEMFEVSGALGCSESTVHTGVAFGHRWTAKQGTQEGSMVSLARSIALEMKSLRDQHAKDADRIKAYHGTIKQLAAITKNLD